LKKRFSASFVCKKGLHTPKNFGSKNLHMVTVVQPELNASNIANLALFGCSRAYPLICVQISQLFSVAPA